MTKYLSCAETAKLLRGALKKEFPGVKFSVRSHTYAGGASIDVSWTDGPNSKTVDKVSRQYAGATFDGMIDLKSYHTSEVNGETVHHGADFVFTRRSVSDAVREDAKQYAIEHLCSGASYDPAVPEWEQRVVGVRPGGNHCYEGYFDTFVRICTEELEMNA